MLLSLWKASRRLLPSVTCATTRPFTRRRPSPQGETSISSRSLPTIAENSCTVAPLPADSASFDFQSRRAETIGAPCGTLSGGRAHGGILRYARRSRYYPVG